MRPRYAKKPDLIAERLEVQLILVTAKVSALRTTTWTHITVVADARELLHTVRNRKSAKLRHVAEFEVGKPERIVLGWPPTGNSCTSPR